MSSPSVSRKSSAESDALLDPPPDGGATAWIVLFGSTLVLFSTAGLSNSYVRGNAAVGTLVISHLPQGVFQSYYQSTLLPSASSSTISLIGALQIFVLYATSPVIGKFFDIRGSSVTSPLAHFPPRTHVSPC